MPMSPLSNLLSRPTPQLTYSPAEAPQPPTLSDDDLSLEDPHPAQWEVILSAKRFNVLNCGRRWGKTNLAKRLIIKASAQDNLPVAYLCPTYKMLSTVWADVVGMCPMAQKDVTQHRLKFPGGGSITMWSADDAANSLRGQKYALVILDEAAIMPGLMDAWERSIRPTLTDLEGGAWFISTPRRGGAFEQFYLRGTSDDEDYEDWQSWQMPTTSNPFIPAREIRKAEKGMSLQAFRQEYEADFEASESDLVHPNITVTSHGRDTIVESRLWKAHVVGIDPGGGDPTAIVPIAVWKDESPTVSRVIPTLNFHQHDEFYRKGDVSSEDIILFLRKMHDIHPLTKVLVAETGGNVITNTLLRAGFPAERYIKERGGGIETVQWLLQSNRITIAPSCKNSWAEFPTYRWRKNRDMETGERYATSTPADNHADAMDARRAALQWAVDAFVNGANRGRIGQQDWGNDRKIIPIQSMRDFVLNKQKGMRQQWVRRR